MRARPQFGHPIAWMHVDQWYVDDNGVRMGHRGIPEVTAITMHRLPSGARQCRVAAEKSIFYLRHETAGDGDHILVEQHILEQQLAFARGALLHML